MVAITYEVTMVTISREEQHYKILNLMFIVYWDRLCSNHHTAMSTGTRQITQLMFTICIIDVLSVFS